MTDREKDYLDKVLSDRFYGQQNQESEDELIINIAHKLQLPSTDDFIASFTNFYHRNPLD